MNKDVCRSKQSREDRGDAPEGVTTKSHRGLPFWDKFNWNFAR